MHPTILHIGSNLPDRATHLTEARRHIAERIGEIWKTSSIYETAAWGNEDQPHFLNQALWVNSPLAPCSLLSTLLGIEDHMGRVRGRRWGPRCIDLDLIFYGEYILQSDSLTIPHPRMRERRFVLVPLCDICPEWKHPLALWTVRELLGWCQDDLEVKLYE